MRPLLCIPLRDLLGCEAQVPDAPMGFVCGPGPAAAVGTGRPVE